MTDSNAALAALDAALAKVDQLEARCCDPGRSPAMVSLRKQIGSARSAVEVADGAAVVILLEEAGAHVGRLQIGCCAPNRMPLYAGVLEDLTMARLTGGPDMHAD